MICNIYEQFRRLIPEPPLQVGTVTSVDGGIVTVLLPGGGLIHARGTATVGQNVFVRDNVIEGSAPNLTLEVIEV